MSTTTVQALVLSGGGARGAFQAGAVSELAERGRVDPAVLTGVSVGALNAGILAQAGDQFYQQTSRLESVWTDLKGARDIYRVRFPGCVFWLEEINLLWHNSLYTVEPLRQKIKDHISPEQVRRSGRKLRVGTVNMHTGRYVIFGEESDQLLESILASTAIPVIFPPVWIDGEPMVDGGVRNVTPLADAFEALANLPAPDRDPIKYEVWVVLAQPLRAPSEPIKRLQRSIGVLTRAANLLVNEIYVNDLKMAEMTNDLIQAGRRSGVHCTLHVIAPEFDPMDTLDFSPRSVRHAVEMGRSSAHAYLKTR